MLATKNLTDVKPQAEYHDKSNKPDTGFPSMYLFTKSLTLSLASSRQKSEK